MASSKMVITPVTIHGTLLCPNVQRVVFTLEEKNLPWKLHYVNFNETEKPDFMKMQPWAQMPVLTEQDGGFTVYESRAICRYLELKHHNIKPQLLPDSAREQALVEQRIYEEVYHLGDAMATVASQIYMYKFAGASLDEVKFTNAVRELKSILDVVDKQLAGHEWWAGDQFSFADVFPMPTLHGLYSFVSSIRDDVKTVLNAHPNVTAWYHRILARPGWQKLLPQLEAAREQARQSKSGGSTTATGSTAPSADIHTTSMA